MARHTLDRNFPCRLPNWAKNSYIQDYLGKGTPGFDFIGYQDTLYGVPTVLQGDSFAYLPDETGELDSYAALFDPKHRGYVSLEDDYTTAGQKTALYLKQSGQAQKHPRAGIHHTVWQQALRFLKGHDGTPGVLSIKIRVLPRVCKVQVINPRQAPVQLAH